MQHHAPNNNNFWTWSLKYKLLRFGLLDFLALHKIIPEYFLQNYSLEKTIDQTEYNED